MNRVLVALAVGAVLASAPALACDDMKSGSYDGGVIASQTPPAPVATPQKVAEPPLVVKQKQAPVKKSTSAAKPLPQGGVIRTGG
jgi:hypothetical protein